MKEETNKKSVDKKKTTKSTSKKTTTKPVAKKSSTKKVSTKSSTKKVEAEVKEAKKVEAPVKKEEVKPVKKETVKPVKKVEDKSSEVEKADYSELSKLLKIVLVIVAILLVFYGLTYLIAANKNKKKDDDKVVSFDYSTILMSNLLSQNKSEYYVLATYKDDNYVETYKSIMTLYTNKADSLKVYNVDLDSKFNSSYFDKKLENSVIDSNISNLKVNGSTLFKVRNGMIESSYVGHQSIIDYLNSIIK